MKNKKYFIVAIIAIIFIIIIASILIILNKNRSASNDTENVVENRVPDVIIKNEEGAELEKDGIAVTDIQIFKETKNCLSVNANLKNNSNKTFKDLLIEIGLYDKKGKYVSSVIVNHTEELKPNKTCTISSSIVDDKKIAEISSAKLISIQNGFEESIDHLFNDITTVPSPE